MFAFTLAVTQITIVSVTVYLHRYSSHRSLELHSGLKHFFRFWLWLTTGMVTRQWTAIHRKHHAVCETEEDPHSPVCRGIGEIFWRGTEAYQEAAKDKALLARYGSGCPEDWLERHVYENNTVGVVFMLFIDLLLFGVAGLTVWAVQMLWIPVFAAGVINGIGHWWGYRNFECPDASRNIVPWGVLIGGEELHNNHHTYPNSAKLSVKPFEVDIGWFWIQLFVKLDLAWVVSTGPVVERVPDKNLLDKDAAWALLNDRFRVMARYAEEVVAPVIEQELQKADDATRKMYKKARVLLCREVTLLDAKSKERLTALVDRNADLRVIYEAHQRLQAIWAKRGGNIEEVVAELVTWCREAEASGTQALNDFAATLKSYAIPQAQSA
ncbi:MAG: transposase [Pseudomonadota bacterium]|nr:transposase [Pseudomonadota bacterium]